jgi:cell wall-associated NlpC family hydrolase
MNDSIFFEPESLRSGTDVLLLRLGDLKLDVPTPSPGVSPEVTASIAKDVESTNGTIEEGEETGQKIKEILGELEASEEEKAADIRGDADVLTELSSGSSADANSPRGAVGDANARPFMSAGVPTSQATAPSMPQMQMPQMPQMPTGGMPMSLPSMTQSDLNSAPNRADLVREMMNQGSSGGSGGSLGAKSNEELHRKIQEYAERLVNHDPPIPYTWGGGHQDIPGPSRGIRDGGTADQFRDFAKSGVDCSGLARWVTYMATDGRVDINGTSQMQFTGGRSVSMSSMVPGDLVFSNMKSDGPHHVGVYVGNGLMLEAQKSGTDLMLSPVRGEAARRYYTY